MAMQPIHFTNFLLISIKYKDNLIAKQNQGSLFLYILYIQVVLKTACDIDYIKVMY